MGFRFRKSINLGGGFRINLSKSGIGYSWGGKGFRVTKATNGRIRSTFSVPGTGISYVSESKKQKNKSYHPHNNFALNPIDRFWKIAFIALFLLFVFCVLVITISFPENSEPPTSDVSSEDDLYMVQQLLELDGHPKIYDNFDNTMQFYSSIGDIPVEVLTIQKYAAKQRTIKERFDDETVLYFIQHPSLSDTIGEITINIFDDALSTVMDLDQAVNLVTQYLPADFIEYYKLDAAYIYGDEKTQVYSYACRLNEKGVEYHNTGMPQYSFYYDFKIFHYVEENYWKIETGYSAYGGKSLGWIEKYSEPWDIDLASYF